MKRLKDFITESLVVNEGGASGHLAHPIDFSFFTAKDLKQLVSDIFSGKIEDVTVLAETNAFAAAVIHGPIIF